MNDPLSEIASHFADAARRDFAPGAFIDPSVPGFDQPLTKFLAAASAEASQVHDLITQTIRASGAWPEGEVRQLWDATGRLRRAAHDAHAALLAADIGGVARGFSVVSLLWKWLRDHDAVVETFKEDAQRVSARSAKTRAEAELRALAAAKTIVYSSEWRASAVARYGFGPRAALDVWRAVCADHPELSSSAGKPKRGRRKA